MLSPFNLTLLTFPLLVVSILSMSPTLALALSWPITSSFSGSQHVSYPTSFATYVTKPRLYLTPPESNSETFRTNDDKDQKQPVFQVTKSQLEGILDQVLQIDFRLQVVSDPDNSEADKNASQEHKVLGEIPVQIKVHRLRLGGLSAPRISSQAQNEQQDPINYGNIRS
ncbi:MAG: hypothetical protein J3R72DRAFT_477928 [Linnemannia gamsii]|nr:MAG: hypothetical protein J3R72DRAFT_477928 [Linnemannia gamsii]